MSNTDSIGNSAETVSNPVPTCSCCGDQATEYHIVYGIGGTVSKRMALCGSLECFSAARYLARQLGQGMEASA